MVPPLWKLLPSCVSPPKIQKSSPLTEKIIWSRLYVTHAEVNTPNFLLRENGLKNYILLIKMNISFKYKRLNKKKLSIGKDNYTCMCVYTYSHIFILFLCYTSDHSVRIIWRLFDRLAIQIDRFVSMWFGHFNRSV